MALVLDAVDESSQLNPNAKEFVPFASSPAAHSTAVPIATDDFILGDRLGRYLDTEDQLRSALHQPPARLQGDRSGRSRVYAGGYYQQGR